MRHRKVVIGSIAAACVALLVLTLYSISRPPKIDVLAKAKEISVAPSQDRGGLIDVRGGTAKQRARLELAIGRFEELGLRLPPLGVHFFESMEPCDGLVGRFSAGTTPWTIGICSPELDWVYEHELAHAWEQETLTDPQRRQFMDGRGLETWAGRDVPWNQRGQEWAAVVIQQGLAGAALPPALSAEAESRLVAFEELTGELSPTLADWLVSRDVPCDARPTSLSLRVADASGHICA